MDAITPVAQFFWGIGGAICTEFLQIYQHYTAKPLAIAERYTRPDYWVTRTLIALLAGGIVVAFSIDTVLLAVYVGAAAPLLLEKLSGFAARNIRAEDEFLSRHDALDKKLRDKMAKDIEDSGGADE